VRAAGVIGEAFRGLPPGLRGVHALKSMIYDTQVAKGHHAVAGAERAFDAMENQFRDRATWARGAHHARAAAGFPARRLAVQSAADRKARAPAETRSAGDAHLRRGVRWAVN